MIGAGALNQWQHARVELCGQGVIQLQVMVVDLLADPGFERFVVFLLVQVGCEALGQSVSIAAEAKASQDAIGLARTTTVLPGVCLLMFFLSLD